MLDGFNGGGFDPNGSIESNVNNHYVFRETSSGSGGGGGGKKGGSGSSGNGCSYIVYAIIAAYFILSNPEAIIMLLLLSATIALGVWIVHKIWTDLSRKRLNIYFRGAAKVVAGYLSAFGFFAILIEIDDFLDWKIFWSISADWVIIFSIVLLIVFVYLIKRGFDNRINIADNNE